MSANTKIVVLRRKELLYTGIFAALGVLFVILLLMLLLPGKAADTSGTPDSPDSTAETVMPDNVADLGRIPQSAQTEDVSTGAVADTEPVLDSASGAVDNAAAVGCADVTGVPFGAGNVRKDFCILCSQTEGAGNDGGKFRARHGLVGHECTFSHAVDDAAGCKFFDSSFVHVIFHIGERCAGSGHTGDTHRSVYIALADARGGF